MTRQLLAAILSIAAAAEGADFRVGVGRLDITPDGPIRMGGYAARTHASTGVAERLWAKALAVEDSGGRRAVIVTMDLLRVPRGVQETVVPKIGRRYGLEPSQVLFNCAHNHSGPAPWENDPFTAIPADEYEACRRYAERVTAGLVGLVGAALADLAPATIRHGVGAAAFAGNRRTKGQAGYEIAYNPDGPTDPRVPVLVAISPKGEVRAILFGYACHNTTLGGQSYDISGDYAGFAQAELERLHPGATALFVLLSAGDQDPHPRGGLDVARRHGLALASAVEEVVKGGGRPISGTVRTATTAARLALSPHTREEFERQLNDPSLARVRNARAALRAYDEGRPVTSVSCPVQAVRLGDGPTIVALGGEPVVDYALRARRDLPEVILAGYSNRLVSYLPSRRVLSEGGYEADESMLYYGLPSRYTPEVEDTLFDAVRRVYGEVHR